MGQNLSLRIVRYIGCDVDTLVQWSRRERRQAQAVIGLYEVDKTRLHEFDLFTMGNCRKKLLTIGRAPLCDIRLLHPTVSRVHCQIQRQPDGSFVIEDTGSTNGLFANEIQVQRVTLAAGMWIFVGEIELVVVGPDRRVRLQATTHSSFVMKAVQVYGSIRKAAAFINKSRSSIGRLRQRHESKQEGEHDGSVSDW